MDKSNSPKQKKIIFSIDSILSSKASDETGDKRSASEEKGATPEGPKWCRERLCRRFACSDMCGLLDSNPGHSCNSRATEPTRRPLLDSKMPASASFFLDRTFASRIQSGRSDSLTVGAPRWLDFGDRSCAQELRERLEAGLHHVPLKSEEQGELHLGKAHYQENTGKKPREEIPLKEEETGINCDGTKRGRFEEEEDSSGREGARGKAAEAEVERMMETNDDDAEFDSYFHASFFNNGDVMHDDQTMKAKSGKALNQNIGPSSSSSSSRLDDHSTKSRGLSDPFSRGPALKKTHHN